MANRSDTNIEIAEKTIHSLNKYSSAKEKIDLFRSLFKGREDVFARRWQSASTGKSGYQPVCENEWAEGLCDKRKFKCINCPNRNLKPLTDEDIYRHLEGKDALARDVIGIYPMLQDEACYFLCADFDEKSYKEDVTAFREVCSELAIPVCVERSRSGNGAHAWIFFESPVPAVLARKLGSGILTKAMEKRGELSFKSYDRLFPNQDTMPDGGFGNLVALPLQGLARKNGNSVFVDEQFCPYGDQWYDYVDIHIPMLERMYQKRVKSYSSIGYKTKLLSNTNAAPDLIYDGKSFYHGFCNDLQNAQSEILIVSPFMRKSRITGLMKILDPIIESGVKVTVVTRPPEDFKDRDRDTVVECAEKLRESGMIVSYKSDFHQKFTVIDQSVVWYGSVNFLSFGTHEESIMRFENTDIAGQLMDTVL